MIAPSGPVYQAGTLSGNPLATSAGMAMLNLITSDLDVYKRLEEKGKLIAEALESQIQKYKIKACVSQLGSMFTLFFTDVVVENFSDAKTSDTAMFGRYFKGMLDKGIYLPPSQFESWFLSDAIGEAEIANIIQASDETLNEISA
jgi:glutamate-1-semialdehyde 2,1-aminomutase